MAEPLARRLFGTDGVRGVAGIDVTEQLAHDLGRAAVLHFGHAAPRVLVVRDTRESGEMLEAALADGLASAGAEVLLGGVLPTPAAPLLVRRHGLDLAVVLSASHNVFSDNGIKFFGGDGFKLSDEAEQLIEARLGQPDRGEPGAAGRVELMAATGEDYLSELQSRFGGLSLAGLNVLLDCANGATYEVAPTIFERLGATVAALAVAPDGRNINDGCGSTHIDRLAAKVRDGGHDIGFAFDGDGDRVLAVDRGGVVVDGDEMLMLIAAHLLREDRLPGHGVAITVMTNFAFVAALREAGIEVASTAVGDRYVLEALRERGWSLGGEQSGHIIELGFAPSGDGIASALLLLESLGGSDLADRPRVQRLPQRLVNVPVGDRDAAQAAPGVREAVARESAALDGRGRVLVRPSGTESLVRVMVEAPSEAEADAACARLVAAVKTAVG